MRLFFCSVLVAFSSLMFSQNNLGVDAISKSITPYANAVVRQSKTVHTVISPAMVSTTQHHIVTVMNSQGVDEGVIVIPYNKLTQVKNLKATIYDATGRVIRKLKMSDFEDVSMSSRYALFEDNRMKRYTPQVNLLPYTVEYEYELQTKTTFFLPSWRPQYSSGLAIEQSSCSFITPVDFQLRVSSHKLPPAKEQTLSSGKQKQLSWSLHNVPAWRDEPFLPLSDSIISWIRFAPVNFEIDGIKGQFTDWKEYGLWCYENLLKGRDKLSKETVANAKNLVLGIDSPREKARIIYEHCQRKNHYVSIQKGKMGGFCPFSAEEVDKLSYGDCKGLCNYTAALLNAVGIEAYYSIVHASEYPISPPEDFANLNFGNHIILCLPLNGDTVWLECTNNKVPFGYIGSFTGNRKAVLCTPQGGVLANTTIYKPEDNCQESKAFFSIDSAGNLTGSVTTRFTGTQYDNRRENLTIRNKEDVDELKDIYGRFPEMNILSYNIEHDKTQIIATEQLQLESSHFAPITNRRMYIPANPTNPQKSTPRELRRRTHDVYIAKGFEDTDSLNFTLPTDYTIEHLPASVNLTEDFGSYRFSVTLRGNTITVARYLRLNPITIPPDRYKNVFDFLSKVYTKDNDKIVLMKQNLN